MLDYRKFDVITFDCYGTLIDWEEGIFKAFRYAVRDPIAERRAELLAVYAEAEAEVEAGDYRPYRDVLEEVSRRVTRKLGASVEDSNLGFLPVSVAQWEPFADSVEALRRLRSRYRLGVISNIDRDLFAPTNAKLGGPFTYIVTAEDVRSYKPSEANFEFAAKVMKVQKKRWLHVAQSLYHDVAPCNRLGIKSVWIDRYGGGAGAVKRSKAAPDAVFPTLAEFADAAVGR